ncbi:hypothetical protein CVT25_006264 [Psilocybe cyanescens]|uniref:Uncharacterized protein n=1 Tax=Psilocybe cyanescens TaxID=93625 RepID=A0A409WYQ3_PSICY|nr:hypothetical protein CVT25_006264 [Psilocybe cyanescens]
MVSKTSLVEFAKHPFTYRERSRMERAKARLETQRASPVLQFGSVTIVNPVYTGSNPYRGPEVYDPKNNGRVFIPVRPPRPAGPREARW